MKTHVSGHFFPARRRFLRAGLCLGLLGAILGPLPCLAAQEEAPARKPLIVYFSQTGNTQKVAEDIQRLTGGDLLRIEPVTPYPADYDTLVKLAKEEQKSGARPAIKTEIPDFAPYSVIFIGYPNWWSGMPMPVFTFLEKARISGKPVAPFDTHGGGGLGHSIEELKTLLPGCNVLKPLSISGNMAGSEAARAEVRKWLEGMGLVEAQGAAKD